MISQTIAFRLTRTRVRAAALIAVCLAVPIAALSQQATVVVPTSAAKVSLTDLDLTTSEGIAAARDRLQSTARQLCSQQLDNLDPAHRVDFLSCVDNSLIHELQQVSSKARAAILAHNSAWPTAADDGTLSQPREIAPDTSVVAISIADLDLLSAHGVLIARERVHNTARRLCSQLNSSQGPASYYSHCVNDATAGALRQINEGTLAN
ncbi:MAG: UrcA family protein [Steroidobacteraceae bacterium]